MRVKGVTTQTSGRRYGLENERIQNDKETMEETYLGLLANLQKNESRFEDVEMADALCISTSVYFDDG